MKQPNTGKQKFGQRLHTVHQACDNCEFESTILGGDWDVHAEVSSRSHHLCYRLTCPHCGTETRLESTLGNI